MQPRDHHALITLAAVISGGDYFDLIEKPDGRCYIAIGDVSGFR